MTAEVGGSPYKMQSESFRFENTLFHMSKHFQQTLEALFKDCASVVQCLLNMLFLSYSVFTKNAVHRSFQCKKILQSTFIPVM